MIDRYSTTNSENDNTNIRMIIIDDIQNKNVLSVDLIDIVCKYCHQSSIALFILNPSKFTNKNNDIISSKICDGMLNDIKRYDMKGSWNTSIWNHLHIALELKIFY